MGKRKLLLCFVSFWVGMASYAISAYPGLIRYRCADGSYVNLQLKGDEYKKWALTEDGYTLLRDSTGEWRYVGMDGQGEVGMSEWVLSAVRSQEVVDFLRSTPKGLEFHQQTGMLKSVRKVQRRELHGPVAGEQKTLVILMQYKDSKLEKLQADFDALFNQVNYRADGARGSVKDFYRENSYGRLDLNCDVLGPFTSAQDMNYYGANGRSDQDEHPEQLFLEALEFASSQVHISDYDTDRDGYINNIHIIFAGYGEEAGGPADAIWSHEALFAEPLVVDGIKITGYSCAPELRGNRGSGISRIGVHCHEIGHSFGALDFYDTDYEVNGEFPGTGKWDLMASGSWNNEGVSPAHFNPYVKTMFGWTDCEVLGEACDNVILPPALDNNKVYRIDTGMDDDYFLLENRQQDGFDEALPGSGLMIYHVLSQIGQRSADNTINAAYPQMCYPVCAGSEFAIPEKNPLSYGNVDSGMCPFPGESTTAEFTRLTKPAALSFDGKPANVGLKNIRQHNDGNISFSVVKWKSLDEQTVVFSEGFEDGSPAWSYVQLQGDFQWKIFNPGILTPTMPVAVEGDQYLAMKIDWKYVPSSVSRVVSPVIKPGKGGMSFLSFKYQNRAALSEHGALKVLYKPVGQLEWQYLATLSEVNDGWQQYQTDLPAAGADFQIAFEGEMEAGLLLLDDIKVYSDAATSTIPVPAKSALPACYGMKGKVCVESDRPALFRVYDLTGMLIYSGTLNEGMNRIGMEPGLYVGISESTVTKFYVY